MIGHRRSSSEKPRYVMGRGRITPPQLLSMVGMGADMFDCVMPSRAARHGMAVDHHELAADKEWYPQFTK